MPMVQRLGCLKYILKKEISSWNDGDTNSSDNSESSSGSEENSSGNGKSSSGSDDNSSDNIDSSSDNDSDSVSVIGDSDSGKENDASEVKVKGGFKLLGRGKGKRLLKSSTPLSVEEGEKGAGGAPAPATITSTVTPDVVDKSMDKSAGAPKSAYPAHFSPFPSTPSPLTAARPFQAVIFADDEDLALTVCETVKAMLAGT